MIREVKFESQDRRIKQILAALNENGIKDIERNLRPVRSRPLQDLRGDSAYLLRECKMGLCRRFCHRFEERMQECCRGSRGYRNRTPVILYPRFCG